MDQLNFQLSFQLNFTPALFFAHSLRITLALFLLYAGLSKARQLPMVRNNLQQSFGFAPAAAALGAPALSVLETGLGAFLLLFPALGSLGMLAAGLLMGGVTLILHWRWMQDAALKCACFGETDRSVSVFDLMRNYFLAAACVWYVWLAPPLPQWSGAVWFAAAGLACFLLVLALECHDIVRLLRASAQGVAW